MIIEWKEYFDNDCKGEDMWGHYRTANGHIYLVADGASNHDGTRTGADVVQLIHERMKRHAHRLARSSELRDLLHSINEESTRVNEGAYAAIAGLLQRGENLYAFGAGDVSIIARKANGKMLQVLPLDLSMTEEEAEDRAKSEIGQVVNNIAITELNYQQRIKQYMHHGLSNAVGMGDEFHLNDIYFDAKADTAMLIATDGITDPFMEPKSQAGDILKADASKLYELFENRSGAEDTAAALESLIWDVQVMEKKRIKPDDRTGLFLFIKSMEDADESIRSVNSMSNDKLSTEIVERLIAQKTASLETEINVSLEDYDRLMDLAKELQRKLAK